MAWLQIVSGIGEKPVYWLPAPLPALGEIAAVKLRVIVPRVCSSIGQSKNYHSNKGPQGSPQNKDGRILDEQCMKVK